MATERAETDRIPVTLALSTIGYLEKLVRQGTHGTSVPGVAKTLIEEGIRLAIKDGLLSIRDIPKGQTPTGICSAPARHSGRALHCRTRGNECLQARRPGLRIASTNSEALRRRAFLQPDRAARSVSAATR